MTEQHSYLNLPRVICVHNERSFHRYVVEIRSINTAQNAGSELYDPNDNSIKHIERLNSWMGCLVILWCIQVCKDRGCINFHIFNLVGMFIQKIARGSRRF